MVRIFFTSLYLPCSLFNQALARDGYRCMITGMIDETSLGNCVDLQAIQEHDGTSDVTIQTAHILNEPTMQGTDPVGPSEDSTEANKVRFHE